MDYWEAAWEWFYAFGDFFTVVYGPVILAALPLLFAAGIFLGLALFFIDFLFNTLLGGNP